MKYLIVLLVVAVAIWLWRRNRREEMEEARPPQAAPPKVGEPQTMLRCAHCGLHLPASDAIAGPGDKVFCSTAHREAGAR
ncbi:MAG: PP0621 family protein [Variovorax sp.]